MQRSKFTQSLLCSLLVLMALTGCASKPKLLNQEGIDARDSKISSLGVVYGQVNKVAVVTDLTGCDNPKEIRQIKDAFCTKPTQKAFLSIYAGSGSLQKFTEAIPIDAQVKPGSIVVLDMTKPLAQHFVRVASLDEHETCRWEGSSNEGLWNGTQKLAVAATGFASFIAAPITLAGYYGVSRATEGGVTCEGWSYKQAFKNVNWKDLYSVN